MFDPGDFVPELEAKLGGFVVRQPARHLREHDLVESMRAPIPGSLIAGGAGKRENSL